LPGVSGLIDQVKVVRGDIRDMTMLERVLGEYEVNAVFHLAAQTIVGIANRNPLSTLETNVRGVWALLEACRRSPTVTEIVLASSDNAYGDPEQLSAANARAVGIEPSSRFRDRTIEAQNCAPLSSHWSLLQFMLGWNTVLELPMPAAIRSLLAWRLIAPLRTGATQKVLRLP